MANGERDGAEKYPCFFHEFTEIKDFVSFLGLMVFLCIEKKMEEECLENFRRIYMDKKKINFSKA